MYFLILDTRFTNMVAVIVAWAFPFFTALRLKARAVKKRKNNNPC
jgi:hypothetical protein